jgi:hypothetical protein
MSLLAGLASDLVAIVLQAYVIYFRRYHRRDLLLAYVAHPGDPASAALRLGDRERSRGQDHHRRPGMVVPAGRAAGVQRRPDHGHIRGPRLDVPGEAGE